MRVAFVFFWRSKQNSKTKRQHTPAKVKSTHTIRIKTKQTFCLTQNKQNENKTNTTKKCASYDVAGPVPGWAQGPMGPTWDTWAPQGPMEGPLGTHGPPGGPMGRPLEDPWEGPWGPMAPRGTHGSAHGPRGKKGSTKTPQC